MFPGAPLGSAQRRFRDSPLLLRPAALPGHPLPRLPEDGTPQAQVSAGKCEGSEGNAQEKRKVVEKAPCKITHVFLFSFSFSTHTCAVTRIMSGTLGSDGGLFQRATVLLLGTVGSHV